MTTIRHTIMTMATFLAVLVLTGMNCFNEAIAQTPQDIPPTVYQETDNEITKTSPRDLAEQEEAASWSGLGLTGAAVCLIIAVTLFFRAPDRPPGKKGILRRYPVYFFLLAAIALFLFSMP